MNKEVKNISECGEEINERVIISRDEMKEHTITCGDSCYWCDRMACQHRGDVGYKCTSFAKSSGLGPVDSDFTNFSEIRKG